MSSLQDQTANRNASNVSRVTTLGAVGTWGLMFFMLLCAFRPASTWRDAALVGALILLIIMQWFRPVAFLVAKSRAGTTVLNLGYQYKTSMRQVALSAILGLAWMVLFSPDPLVSVTRVGIGLYFCMGALVTLLTNFQPTVVAEKGIYSPRTIVWWNEIASRQWLNQHEDALLVLKLKNRRWPFDEATMKIPTTMKEAVEQLLVQHRAG